MMTAACQDSAQASPGLLPATVWHEVVAGKFAQIARYMYRTMQILCSYGPYVMP